MDFAILQICISYWILSHPLASGFVFPNHHMRNGDRQDPSINTPLKCLRQCSVKGRPQCVGFDFDRNQDRCYLHSSGTECGSLVMNTCCDHYRFYDCTLVSTTPVVSPAPVDPPPLSVIPAYQGVHIPGGILQKSLTSLENCYRVCHFSPTCQSFEWNHQDSQCFLHRPTTACNNLQNLPLTTHYRIRANCNPVPSNCFNVEFQEVKYGSRSNGRQLAGNIGYNDCVALCRSRQGCQAVDWDIKKRICFEHNTAGIPLPNKCCRHARKLCNDGTTQLPAVTTTRPTTTTVMGPSTRPPMVQPPAKHIQDDGKCPSELLAVATTRSSNGMDVPGVMDPESCKEWCLGNSTCAAVDFDHVATSGTRCYYHVTGVYDKANALPDPCCTQYRRLPPCQNKRCWSMSNMEVTMERTISGVTLFEPIQEFLDLDPTMNYTDITLDECTGLCRMQADFTRNQNTGILSGFFPIEAERSCYPAGNPIANSHKNCEVTVKESDGTYENVSLVCYCSADQCNAFWAQVVEACVAHYSLDCHTLDLTFGQRHGEGIDMHFSGEDQAKNWSAIFNGSSYIQIDSFMNNVLAAVGPAATDNIRPDFSLLFWFKFTSPEASNMTIISNGLHDRASLDIFTSPLNATHRTIHATVRINMMAFSASVAAEYNKWQYFFMRIVPIADYELLIEVGDNVNMKTDSDQVPTTISTLMTGASIDLRSNPLCIGKQYVPDTNLISTNTPGEFYIGLLDEIWMFRRGLKDTELQALIQASYYPMRMNA